MITLYFKHLRILTTRTNMAKEMVEIVIISDNTQNTITATPVDADVLAKTQSRK